MSDLDQFPVVLGTLAGGLHDCGSCINDIGRRPDKKQTCGSDKGWQHVAMTKGGGNMWP